MVLLFMFVAAVKVLILSLHKRCNLCVLKVPLEDSQQAIQLAAILIMYYIVFRLIVCSEKFVVVAGQS